MPKVIPFLAVLILYASSALAQAGEGPYARITVIRPLPGRDSAFQAGYRRHLDWHRQNKDPWYWYGWWVVMGLAWAAFLAPGVTWIIGRARHAGRRDASR